MAKRFTDTDKWKRPWFRALPMQAKLVWFYILDNCDHCGVWHADFELMAFQTGVSVGKQDFESWFMGKFVAFEQDKYFFPSFVTFQQGKLSAAKNAHKPIIEFLEKYNLSLDESLPISSQKNDPIPIPSDPIGMGPSNSKGIGNSNGNGHQGGVGGLREQAQEAANAWSECLKKYGAERNLFPFEHVTLARNIQARGLDAVLLAILGQRYEPESETFKPSRHLSLNRLFDPEKFDRFVNLGAQARKKLQEREQEQARLAEMQAVAEEPAPNPAEVRQFLDGLFGKMPKVGA